MFSLASLKAALARILDIGEDEAHTLVAAIEADLAPMLADFKTQLLADLTAVIAEGRVDAEKLAEDITAKLATLGNATTPPAAS